jgi:hypothetical protein
MVELESSLHLFQTPLYRGSNGEWKKSFIDAVCECQGKTSWDVSAILSILSFGYPCGDRTLVNEVRRRPWLSSIGSDNEPRLEEVPQHGRLWLSSSQIAKTLFELLCDEAIEVCRGRKEIYLLLSGGLDSRVVAGVLATLRDEGRIDVTPIGVTWGLEDSRDVYYARMTADILGFEWVHLGISPEDLLFNLEKEAISIGNMTSPVHLHRMQWFKNLAKDALVLAGSYGDSIGRAEFSGHNVLELDYLRPADIYGLLRKDVLGLAFDGVMKDLKELHDRSPGQPKYVYCEHEMQGHYMRNMISHTMSIINNYCSVYQMFTNPKTYSYMWAIHPALRDDRIYAELFEQFNPRLARIPWARTNRALSGRTIGAKSGLRKKFHEYKYWAGETLFDKLSRYVDPDWFSETGIFRGDRIAKLTQEVYRTRNGESVFGSFPHEKWLWLAAFRHMAEHIESKGKSVGPSDECAKCLGSPLKLATETRPPFVRLLLSRSAFLYKMAKQLRELFGIITKRIRKNRINNQAIRKYPPQKLR